MSREDLSRASRWLWHKDRSRGFRFSERLDPVLASLVIAVSLVFVVLGLVFGGLRSHDLAAEIVPDRRILGSFTKNEGCFETVSTGRRGRVWVTLSQDTRCQSNVATGGIAPYNPVWRTWGQERRPFSSDRGRIVPNSLERFDDTLWVAGDDGGLAKQDGRNWSVWLTQSRFVDRNSPVKQSDIAASSSGGQGTYFITEAGGLAYYNANNASWQNLGRVPKQGDGGAIRRLVQLGDGYWLHRERQLWHFPTNRQGQLEAPDGKLVMSGCIAQVSASGDELLVLTTDRCNRSDGAPTFERLLSFSDPDVLPKQLLDNSEAPKAWKAGDIRYVAQLDDRIVLAGPRGATQYLTESRSWHPITTDAISAFAAVDGEFAWLGGEGFLVSLKSATVDPIRIALPLSQRSVLSIMPDDAGGVHASDDQGSLWYVPADREVVERFEVTAPVLQERAQTAISSLNADIFVFRGKTVVMTHGSRRYTTLANSPSTAVIRDAKLRADTPFGIFLYAPGQTGRLTFIDPLSPNSAPVAEFSESERIVSLSALDDRSALATTVNGRLIRITAQGDELNIRDEMDGQPYAGLNGPALRDVAPNGENNILFASTEGVFEYDATGRSWKTLTRKPAVSVAATQNHLFTVDLDQNLVQHSTAGRSPVIRVGGGDFSFSPDAEMSDILYDEALGLIVLAKDKGGQFTLERYHPAMRRSTKLGSFPAAERGQILHYGGEKDWLVIVGDRAYRSSEDALATAVRGQHVLAAWIDADTGQTVTVESDSADDSIFLHRHAHADRAATCLFRGSVSKPIDLSTLQRFNTDILSLAGPSSLQLYRVDAHRWYNVPLPKAPAYDFEGAHGVFWAREKLNPTAPLLRIDPGLLQQGVSSCTPDTPALRHRSFSVAAVHPVEDRVLHQRSDGSLGVTVAGADDRVIFEPSDPPKTRSAPLRAYVQSGRIWIAFADSVYSYDPSSRLWQEIGRFTPRAWQQVVFSDGRGAFAGKTVASFADAEGRWVRVVGTASDPRDSGRVDEGRIKAPQPAGFAQGADREVLQSWQQSGVYLFQFEDRIAALNAGDLSWLPSKWKVGGLSERFGVVQQRLVSWNPQTRDFQFQGSNRISRALAGPYTARVTQGSTAFVTKDGLPGWVTPGGALVMCQSNGSCRQQSAEAPLFDPSVISNVYDMGEGLVLLAENDRAAYLAVSEDEMAMQRLFDAGNRPSSTSPTQDWLTEEISEIWPARDGGYRASSPKGDVVLIGRPSAGGLRVDRLGSHRLINPDDNTSLSEAGDILQGYLRIPLPFGLEPDEIMAVGRLEGRVWLQHEAGISAYHIGCRNPALPEELRPSSNEYTRAVDSNADEQETEEGSEEVSEFDCITEQFSAPLKQERIAYLKGNWNEELSAQMQNGADLTWRAARLLRSERWNLNADRKLAKTAIPKRINDRFFTRPDGAVSLSIGASVATTSGGGLAVTLVNGTVQQMVAPDHLTLESLDLKWLQFEPERQRFNLRTQTNAAQWSATTVFTENGTFRPFATKMALPQSDGALLVQTRFGIVRVNSETDLARSFDPSQVQFAPGASRAGTVLDEGGIWIDDEYTAAPGSDARKRSSIDLRMRDFTASGDRRKVGVVLLFRDQNAWSRQNGFLWDTVRDLGWSTTGQPVALTNLGPVDVNDVLAGSPQTPIAWSGQDSFLALRKNTQLTAAPKDFRLRALPGNRVQFDRDKLYDGAAAFGQIHLVTGRGYERADRFGFQTKLLDRSSALRRVFVHRATPRVVLLGDNLIRLMEKKDGSVRSWNQAPQTLRGGRQYEIGPLDVMGELDLSGARMRYSLEFELRQDAGRTNALRASKAGNGSRFAFDQVTQIAVNEDGNLNLATKAGWFQGANFGLVDSELLAVPNADWQIDLMHIGRRLFLLQKSPRVEKPSCAEVLSSLTTLGDCDLTAPVSQVMASTSVGELLATREEDRVTLSIEIDDDFGRRPVRLQNGRFSFDRITDLTVCGRHTHFRLDIGLQVILEGRSAEWKKATPHSDARRLAEFFCGENTPHDGVADYIWSKTEPNSWKAVDPDKLAPSESFDSRDLLSLLDRPGSGKNWSVLRRSLETELRYSDRSGTWRKLRIGDRVFNPQNHGIFGPAAAIDVPSLFLKGPDVFWAVTADGLVPYHRSSDTTQLRVMTKGPSPVSLPGGCAPVAAHWISQTVTDIHCLDGRRLEVGFAKTGPDISEHRLPRDQKAKTGHLQIISNVRKGLKDLTLTSEKHPASVFEGGFAFDRIRSASRFSQDQIAVASGLGLYVHRGSLSLGVDGQLINKVIAKRRDQISLEDVHLVARLADDSSLCVQFGNPDQPMRQSVRMAGEEVVFGESVSQKCWTFHSADPLREIWTSPNKSTVSYLSLEPRFDFVDELVAGRFQADRVASLEVFATDSVSNGVCIPSRIRDVSIAGTELAATQRVRGQDCEKTPLRRQPPQADEASFYVEKGRLWRQRIRDR